MEGKAKEEKAVQWLFILTVAFRVRCRLLLEMVRLCNGTPSRYSRSGHPWGAPCASLSTPAEHHCLVIELLSNIFNHHVAMGSEVLQNLTHPGLLICSSQLYSCNCIYWKARRVFFNSLENWKLFNLPFQNPFNPSLYQKEKAGWEISFWSLDHWAHCKMMLRLRHNHLTSKKKIYLTSLKDGSTGNLLLSTYGPGVRLADGDGECVSCLPANQRISILMVLPLYSGQWVGKVWPMGQIWPMVF